MEKNLNQEVKKVEERLSQITQIVSALDFTYRKNESGDYEKDEDGYYIKDYYDCLVNRILIDAIREIIM